MIQIKDLKINVGDKEILKGVSLNFEVGKNYLLLGRNGSGKSSLSSFLMGNPVYDYKSGEVIISGHPQGVNPTNNVGVPLVGTQNLLELSPEDRSKAGLFLSFQNIPEIAGIKLSEYLRTIYNINLKKENPEIRDISPFIFKRFIKKYLVELNIPESFLDRDLNVGFSGGEKRKIEILQMKLIGPKYIILDEIDSGLDLDAFKIIANLLKDLSSETNTLIIITHHFKILDYINIDKIYVMKDGNIVRQGGLELAKEISEKGFEEM